MKKVKITADHLTAPLLQQFFTSISTAKTLIAGLELEHLVLLDWNKRNFLKVLFQTEYKASLAPHEAIAMYRMLMRWGIDIDDASLQIARNQVCEQISQQKSNLLPTGAQVQYQ